MSVVTKSQSTVYVNSYVPQKDPVGGHGSYLREKETEFQRDCVTWPRQHSQDMPDGGQSPLTSAPGLLFSSD